MVLALAGQCRDKGYTLVILLASITFMLIAMGVAAPSWQLVMKDDREQELSFRGGQLADAIQRYMRKNANAMPTSMDLLVKGRYLRKAPSVSRPWWGHRGFHCRRSVGEASA